MPARRSLLVRLFPSRWRARYADEFSAVLEQLPLSATVVIDVWLASIHARAQERNTRQFEAAGGGHSMLTRSFLGLAILAAIATAVLFVLHSFAYLLVAVLSLLFALAAGAARLLAKPPEMRRHS